MSCFADMDSPVVSRGSWADLLDSVGDNRQQITLADHEVVLAFQLDLGARVFREQHRVIGLHLHLDALAVVQHAAAEWRETDCHDLCNPFFQTAAPFTREMPVRENNGPNSRWSGRSSSERVPTASATRVGVRRVTHSMGTANRRLSGPYAVISLRTRCESGSRTTPRTRPINVAPNAMSAPMSCSSSVSVAVCIVEPRSSCPERDP